MNEWNYQMTQSLLHPEDLPDESGQAGHFDEIVDGQRKSLNGDGWELVSHCISPWESELSLSLVWRKPAR